MSALGRIQNSVNLVERIVDVIPPTTMLSPM